MINSDRKKLRSARAARHLGISPSTLAKWRMRNYGPPYRRCGPRIVFYYVDELDAWLESCGR